MTSPCIFTGPYANDWHLLAKRSRHTNTEKEIRKQRQTLKGNHHKPEPQGLGRILPWCPTLVVPGFLAS